MGQEIVILEPSTTVEGAPGASGYYAARIVMTDEKAL